MKSLIYVERGTSVALQVGSKEPMVVVPQSRNGLGCRHCAFNSTPACDIVACDSDERFDREDVAFLPVFPDKSREDKSRGGEDE